MAAPTSFAFSDSFRHQSPEAVRRVLRGHGFSCDSPMYRAGSEIWIRADWSSSGYWIVRLDTQGHGRFAHSKRPHYHKNWVASHDQLQAYLGAYDPTASVYDDEGRLLGEAAHSVHPEHLSKAQHIPR